MGRRRLGRNPTRIEKEPIPWYLTIGASLLAKRLAEKLPAILPAPKLPPHLEADAHLGQPLGEPQAPQKPNAVRGDLDARADLAQLRRLLVDRYVVQPRPP